jgi:TonB family protein
MKLMLGVAIAILTCALSAAPQTDEQNRTSRPIPKLPSLTALSALIMDAAALQAPAGGKTTAGGMTIYQVFVDSDGNVLRSQPITQIQDLQPSADEVMKTWRFKPVENRGSRTAWWSFVGICYSPEWTKFLPCAPPPGELQDYAAQTIPTRIYTAGTRSLAKSDRELDLDLRPDTAPNPPYPSAARDARVQGIVQLDVVVAPDGHVSQAKIISGHPMLTGAAVKLAQDTRWTPPTFLNHPVEAEIHLNVGYSLSGPH